MSIPPTSAPNYGYLVAEALIVVPQQCKDDLSRAA